MSLLLFLKEIPLIAIELSFVEPIDESFLSSRPGSDSDSLSLLYPDRILNEESSYEVSSPCW